MPNSNLTMSLVVRFALAFLLATAQLPAAFALDNAPASVVQELVPFSSDEGLARLARSTAKVDFPVLANQFEAQSNATFCGPTSAAIVLNAVAVGALTYPAIGAACARRTFNTFRLTTIRPSRASRRTT